MIPFFLFLLLKISCRDGVGDGQIPEVKGREVEAIEQCFEEVGMDNVKFTFIIVSKRINTKFFRDKENPFSGRKLLLIQVNVLHTFFLQELWWTMW